MGRDIKTVNYFFAFFIVGLTILFGSSLFIDIQKEFRSINDYALIEGKASYNKDLLYRRWASMHGGVYAPITKETPPNPILSHIPDRDITTENGIKLTLVNPAYMTRQVHEIAGGQYGVKGHITSLNPIREENRPDEWETKALQLFETGESEFSSVEKIDSMKYMRYMHTMTVEQSCLKCHAVQGYKVGDVRGGISVSVPMDTYDKLASFHKKNLLATYSLVYAIVLILSGLGFKRLKKEITNRNLLQTKIIASEALLSRTQEIAHVGSWNLDLTANKLTWSDETYRIFGCKPQEFAATYEAFLGFIHPDDRMAVNEAYSESLREATDSYEIEHRIIRQGTGEIRHVYERCVHVRDDAGTILQSIGMVQDITEDKQAEEDLTRISRIMINSQEIAHLGSFEYVAATQTTIWSEEEYRIYGLDPNGPSPEYNVMLEKYIHPDDAKLLHNAFMAAMQSQGIYELEHRVVRPDGSVRWVYDKANPYFDEHGNLLRYVGATLDITDRKRLQKELENLNTELELKVKQRTALLEVSNKELEAFSYSVSHDLRSPLRHINGYIGMLNMHFSDELSEKTRHYLDTISRASSQMGILIDELLQYSRTGRQEMVKNELDMNLLVKEVFEELKSDAKGREINWEMQKLPKVYGDNVLLKQVWANLLGNAVKYTSNQQTAKISVSCREETKSFVFCVSDNGVGFDMKYVHKLFGVFQRLHSQAEFEGTGIGLANVQRIVHKHLGRVWAEAEPGKGAKFYFSLPKYQEEKS